MSFKIYTKTGDKGETSLYGGKRLPKNDRRIEAYGTVDELNAFVGLLRDHLADEPTKDFLKEIQDRLFTLGSNLASDPSKEMITPDIFEHDIKILEDKMDEMTETLPPLKYFVLPGGHATVSFAHLCRTVCRRAERNIISLAQAEPTEEIIIRYMNRLSDYFFILGRKIGQDLGVEEIKWVPRITKP